MKTFFAFLFVFFFFSALEADSSVWKITKGDQTLYLGGTIHVLRASDFPLPVEFEQAYARSDTLVFETDLHGTQDAAFAAALADKMFLPSGKTLADILKPSTHAALKRYLSSQGHDIRTFESLQPWMVMLTLTQFKLSRLGIDQNGVDAYYSRKALQEKKTQRHLETPEEQIALITRIGQGEEDAMILQTLHEMEMIPEMIHWLVSDWREGKTDRIQKELVETMKEESPRMYREILKNRNDAWMPKLMGLMREGKRGLVLVGAMHLPGEEGLLKSFARNGYKVERFRP